MNKMMKYDFDAIVPRRGTDSYKWDSADSPDVLPLWVADMDFRTAPPVIEALRRRVEHGIFGYARVPQAYYDAVTGWFGRRHGWKIRREWIVYTTGVVPALSAVIQALTAPGDKVLVQTPVYNCFFSSIRNNGCEAVESPLLYADGVYGIDFADLERKAADPKVRLLLLCNPHNPAGRVWSREELRRVGEICLRHDVFVVADEIHCDLVFAGHAYTPFASVAEEFLLHSATCTSPSKAFNLAGLQIANIVCADEEKRRKIDRSINVNEVCDVNPFGIEALQAAYNEGEAWLDALREYLFDNYGVLKDYFHGHLPHLPVLSLEGTYLAWIDCSALNLSSGALEEMLLENEKVWINAGSMYSGAGESFIRINLACPRQVLKEGLERLGRALKSLPVQI